MYSVNFLKQFILVVVIAGISFVTTMAHAEVKTYEGVGEYVMSDFETVTIAKERAKMYAERNAQEKAGVYVSSYSKSINSVINTDEVEAMTATILQVLDVKYETVSMGEGVMYRATVKVKIDSDEIPSWLARDAKERAELVAQNKALKQSFDEQDKNITDLKAQIFGTTNSNDKEKLQGELAKIDKDFLSNQKILAGNQSFAKKDYANAVKFYDEAIKLDSNNLFAYAQRGAAYCELGNYAPAIADLTKYIAFYPNDFYSHTRRAIAYLNTGNIDECISDLKKLTKIAPNSVEPYLTLGIIYQELGQTETANAYFNKVAELQK